MGALRQLGLTNLSQLDLPHLLFRLFVWAVSEIFIASQATCKNLSKACSGWAKGWSRQESASISWNRPQAKSKVNEFEDGIERVVVWAKDVFTCSPVTVFDPEAAAFCPLIKWLLFVSSWRHLPRAFDGNENCLLYLTVTFLKLFQNNFYTFHEWLRTSPFSCHPLLYLTCNFCFWVKCFVSQSLLKRLSQNRLTYALKNGFSY